jgi:anti-sigma regulatory factor (Ser/Thr protein kinase)
MAADHLQVPGSADRRLAETLERSDHTPAAARRKVQQLAGDHAAAAPHLPMLTLLVSEVVTNAVVHPEVAEGSEIELEVIVTSGATRVVVSDEGSGFSPSDTPRGPRTSGGYGLRLLEAGASRWGTTTAGGRFAVWFEIDHAEPLEKSA